MTEDVLVSVTGLHTLNTEQQEEVEVTSPGKYYQRNGKHYVLYEEVEENTGDVVKNRLKLFPDGMELMKNGPVSTRMVFERGKKNQSWYGTPMGNMMTGIEVTDLELREEENLIDVNVAYELEMNYEKVADSQIHIRIMARDSGLFHLL